MQLRYRLALLFALVIYVFNVNAQEGGPPMLIDDARVADYKQWELNTSINTSLTNRLALSLPHIDLNYGVYHNLQLKIEAPFNLHFNKEKRTEKELGEVIAGVKYRFLDEEKHFISAATFPQYTFNLNKGVFLPIFIEKTFDKFLVGTTYGHFWGNEKNRHSEYGAIVGYKPVENWDLMAEYFSTTHHFSGHDTNGYVNLGFRVALSDNFMIMGSFGSQVLTPKALEREKFISWIGIKNLF